MISNSKNQCMHICIYIYIYFIYVIYIHTYKHTYIYIPQQRDIYETVIFRFLQIFYGRFVRDIYIYICVYIYINNIYIRIYIYIYIYIYISGQKKSDPRDSNVTDVR